MSTPIRQDVCDVSEMIRLSYAELADKFGISKEAAKPRVRRAGWHRIVDNTGIARFNIPKDVLDTIGRHPIDMVTTDKRVASKILEITLAAIDTLKAALERSETARANAERRSRQLSEQIGRV